MAGPRSPDTAVAVRQATVGGVCGASAIAGSAVAARATTSPATSPRMRMGEKFAVPARIPA